MPSDSPTVFISYSHADEAWKDRLVKQLRVLALENVLDVWDDRRIATGDDWRPAIEDAMEKARVAVFLVTADFLTSKFIREEEVPRILERRGDGLRVVPVIVKSCPWQHVPWMSQIQGRPTDGRPLAMMKRAQADDALSAIAVEIANLLRGEERVAQPKDKATTTEPRVAISRLPETGEHFGGDETSDVYLAAVADSLKTTRKRVAKELIRRGYTVREKPPPPPYDVQRHRAAARDAIERAKLSVHLLDGLPGAEIEGDEENTYPREQVKLGRDHAASQIIWVPRALDLNTIDDKAQAEFLHQLEHGERGERRYDFVRGAAADLADDLAEKLRQLDEAERTPQARPLVVLLDVQRKDTPFVLDLIGALTERQVAHFLYQHENDPRKNDEILRARLRDVGAMIVVYGQVQADWVSGRLEQAANFVFSERVPLRAFCVYLAPPRENKVDLRRRLPLLNLHVLDNCDGFDPQTLDPLFHDLTPEEA